MRKDDRIGGQDVLTAAEMDFIDWYDLQDAFLQSVIDLVVRQAREEGNSFFDQFGINAFSESVDIRLPIAA